MRQLLKLSSKCEDHLYVWNVYWSTSDSLLIVLVPTYYHPGQSKNSSHNTILSSFTIRNPDFPISIALFVSFPLRLRQGCRLVSWYVLIFFARLFVLALGLGKSYKNDTLRSFFCHQSLHFFYGLGALVSPVIAEPFLRSACADGHFQKNIFGWTLENSTLETLLTYSVDGMQFNVTLNETISRGAFPKHIHTKSLVQYAYWLVALLQVSVPVSS